MRYIDFEWVNKSGWMSNNIWAILLVYSIIRNYMTTFLDFITNISYSPLPSGKILLKLSFSLIFFEGKGVSITFSNNHSLIHRFSVSQPIYRIWDVTKVSCITRNNHQLFLIILSCFMTFHWESVMVAFLGWLCYRCRRYFLRFSVW